MESGWDNIELTHKELIPQTAPHEVWISQQELVPVVKHWDRGPEGPHRVCPLGVAKFASTNTEQPVPGVQGEQRVSDLRCDFTLYIPVVLEHIRIEILAWNHARVIR